MYALKLMMTVYAGVGDNDAFDGVCADLCMRIRKVRSLVEKFAAEMVQREFVP